ncbi:MAG: phosphoenolpyruvate--protein phosphotransferase [Planctomycetota bacterium]
MKKLIGQPVSSGYAEGTTFVYRRDEGTGVPRYSIGSDEVGTEHDRFRQAIQRSCEELEQLRARIKAELGQGEAEIFGAHLALLQDAIFREKTRNRIERELVNVEQAVDAEIAELTRALEQVESEYLRERTKDARDVKRRVLKHLGHGPEEELKDLPPGVALVATDLLPSDTLDLDREHVAAIIMEHGGETGHAAILARALGIPAVTGVRNVTAEIPAGAHVHVDGETGEVTVNPTEIEENAFGSAKAAHDREMARAAEASRGPCVTTDGQAIRLQANINRLDEVHLPAMDLLDGVGLFRTEYLFLGTSTPPTEQQQTEVYTELAQAVAPRPVTIRTLDLGGDKKPAFVAAKLEANPYLGSRGLRFSLAERELFATQLRAIARASQAGNVSVLLPMVLGIDDFHQAVEMLDQACRDVGVERRPPVGAMIETPAAVFQVDRIVRRADFLSVGTNDLVQFVLAADRNVEGLLSDALTLHPGMIRVLQRIIRASRDAGVDVSVCGEAAGEPAIARLLVGLGFRALSMSPRRAAAVHTPLCASDLADLEEVARQAGQCGSEREIKALLESAGSVASR